MLGSLTRDGGENVPGIPGACVAAILRIWQDAHCRDQVFFYMPGTFSGNVHALLVN